MIDAISLYEDITKDSVNTDQNGSLSIARFNRLSRRAELLLLDWLTGDVAGQTPPAPWLTQKNKDWLSPILVRTSMQVVNGLISKPSDYYLYDNLFRITGQTNDDCDEDADFQAQQNPRPNVTVLDGDSFNERTDTWIEELKPSFQKPIGQVVGNNIEVFPSDLGSVTLQYIRYPVFAVLTPGKDPLYNTEIATAAVNYEWPEAVRSVLIYAITDMASNNTREQALKQFNAASGKTMK